MAIDPRIALATRVPDVSGAINIFENAIMNAQTRDIRQAEAERAAKMQPFQLQQAQQNVDINQQTLDANQIAAQQASDQRILKSVNDFAIGNQSVINQTVNTGDPAPLLQALTNRRAQLVQQNLPVGETDEAIAMLGQGDIQGVVSKLSDSVALFNQQQGRTARVTSSKILEDGTTIQSLSTGGTNVISPSGNALTGDERTTALNKSLQTKVQQKGNIAQAVSDVKVDEVVALESASKETAQKIESQRVTIDETKAKNIEARDSAINSKNARRKEADDAILQIDNLLTDDRFTNAFGKLVTTTPELLRRQISIDAIADVNQIKGLITLESRQKLKGQGTITDSEQKILAQSATVLDNPLISDDRARRELRKIKRVFEDSSDRNKLKRETRDRVEAEAQAEAKGDGMIMTDANGNRARVFDDGTFEEL